MALLPKNLLANSLEVNEALGAEGGLATGQVGLGLDEGGADTGPVLSQGGFDPGLFSDSSVFGGGEQPTAPEAALAGDSGFGLGGGLLSNPLDAARERFQNQSTIGQIISGAGEIAAGIGGRPSPAIQREDIRIKGVMNNLVIMKTLMDFGAQGAKAISQVPITFGKDGTPDFSQRDAAEAQFTDQFMRFAGKGAEGYVKNFVRFGTRYGKATMEHPAFKELVMKRGFAGQTVNQEDINKLFTPEDIQKAILDHAVDNAYTTLTQAPQGELSTFHALIEHVKKSDFTRYNDALESDGGIDEEELNGFLRDFGQGSGFGDLTEADLDLLRTDPVRFAQVYPDSLSNPRFAELRAAGQDDRLKEARDKRDNEREGVTIKLKNTATGEVWQGRRDEAETNRKMKAGWLEVKGNETDAGAKASGLSNSTLDELKEATIQGVNRRQSLRDIQDAFKPELLTVSSRVSNWWTKKKSLAGLPLTPEEKQRTDDLETLTQRSLDDVTKHLKEMSGVAINEAEAARLMKVLANAAKDSPIAFEIKLREVVRAVDLEIARNLILVNGSEELGIKPGDVLNVESAGILANMDNVATEMKRDQMARYEQSGMGAQEAFDAADADVRRALQLPDDFEFKVK